MRKDLERACNELGMAGASLPSTEVNGIRLVSELDGVRERPNGDNTYQRATVNRDEAAEVKERDRAKAKRIRDTIVYLEV